jgi:hypothetical protein
MEKPMDKKGLTTAGGIPVGDRHRGGSSMYAANPILIVLFVLSTLGVAEAAFAAEESSSVASKPASSPSLQSTQKSNALRQVAIALSGDRDAIRALHGLPYEDDNRDRLQPPIPGLDCGIDRNLSYVSCYSALVTDQKDAENAFSQLVADLEAALPSGRWQPVTTVPTLGSSRSVSYADEKTAAQIDIELLKQPTAESQSSYVISLYGWTGF